ncbi:maf-like protein DDB_G0281937 isoform X3 [Coffea eugenioides]|uniref:maf-like protein DDB_G0281937 isoform X3 n=1 Tax=Coffea eugenioides TaxID=49369 RepID=UPI000F615568|nr:maf-like protein DDB_G0281937 isoform X3 [Coffea eugenioides]
MAPRNASFKKIILGSSSMARRQILSAMGFEFTVMTADIDEKSVRKEKPEDLVMALAEAKRELESLNAKGKCRGLSSNVSNIRPAFHDKRADAIISRLKNTSYLGEKEQPVLLITADTVAVFEGTVREKPSSKEEARKYLRDYSRGHTSVLGSVVVSNLTSGNRKGGWDRAEVYFHEIPDDVIDNLIEEGIILNVSGALMLEHPLTLPFVDTVIGTADHVMGLSKALTEKLIQEAL